MNTTAASPSSAATGSRSRARTAPTRTRPTRTCSPRRSTGSSSASRSRASGSARSSPAPCSSTRATATSRARRCSARKLAPETPAYDVQQACGTGLETVDRSSRTRSRSGQIDVGIAGGVDTASDAPIAVNEDLRHILLDLNRAKSLPARARTLTRLRPGQVVPEIPRNAEPRTGLSMGEHAALMARDWGVTREEQDELAVASHQRMAAAYERGFFDDLVTPVPRARARPEPARGLVRRRSWRSSSRCSAATTGR